MDWKSHLFIGFLFLTTIKIYFNLEILSTNFLNLFIATMIFSLLPDIDHSKSHISNIFIVFSLILGTIGLYQYLGGQKLAIIKTFTAILLLIYHHFIAIDSPHHRRFPHTFTFAILSSLILAYYTNLFIGIVGFFSFILHLTADNHIMPALRKDKLFWKKVLFLD